MRCESENCDKWENRLSAIGGEKKNENKKDVSDILPFVTTTRTSSEVQT
jgi:hypothetical protein